MSARALRRLQEQQAQQQAVAGSEPQGLPAGDTDDEEDAPVHSSQRKNKKNGAVNPFDLLNEGADGAGGDAGDAGSSSDDGEGATREGKGVSASASAKRKKKKKAAKAKTAAKGKEREGSNDGATAVVDGEDEIDRTLREMNITITPSSDRESGASSRDAKSTQYGDSRPLLGIDTKFLSGDAEMRRIFGSRVVSEATAASARGRGAHGAVTKRAKTWFPTPKPTWPRTGRPGVSMEYLGSFDAGRDLRFELVHNAGYQEAQGRFLDAVDTLDPSSIAAVLNMHPYHVDALLQLSEICKMSGDPQLACDLIERALWAVETSFHAMFNLALGTCRLSYRRRENRGFFLALFRYAQFMSQRGCWRTALEYTRTLLSLDPEDDPLCALLMIDYLALRAGEHGFLCRLHSEWDAHRDLSLLPNFAYSIPLARFHLGDTETADAMLQKAIVSFPGVVPLLVTRCGVLVVCGLALLS
eukprot:Opistho-2@27278